MTPNARTSSKLTTPGTQPNLSEMCHSRPMRLARSNIRQMLLNAGGKAPSRFASNAPAPAQPARETVQNPADSKTLRAFSPPVQNSASRPVRPRSKIRETILAEALLTSSAKKTQKSPASKETPVKSKPAQNPISEAQSELLRSSTPRVRRARSNIRETILAKVPLTQKSTSAQFSLSTVQTTVSIQEAVAPKAHSHQAVPNQPEVSKGSKPVSASGVMEVDKLGSDNATIPSRKRGHEEPQKSEEAAPQAKRSKTSEDPAPNDALSAFGKLVEMTLRNMDNNERYMAEDDIYDLLKKYR
ncbi:hypothetical protein L596_013801 [Steinernema carpocapsae]|uniref:Uncharacterized protein n=1 Tax=Steinernema carpocapsae TaxID=34508 RepID=A0A4U5P2G0_STECR|nr:hypothetical protein L596_013801 [Steinernema carpocapsae]